MKFFYIFLLTSVVVAMATSMVDKSIPILHGRIAYEAAKAGKKRLKRIDPFRGARCMLSQHHLRMLKRIPRKAAKAARARRRRIYGQPACASRCEAQRRGRIIARLPLARDFCRCEIPHWLGAAERRRRTHIRAIWENNESHPDRAVSPLTEPWMPRT